MGDKYERIIHVPGPTLHVSPSGAPEIVRDHYSGEEDNNRLDYYIQQGWEVIGFVSHHSAQYDCTVTMYSLGAPTQ
jgi:hypothetical protein